MTLGRSALLFLVPFQVAGAASSLVIPDAPLASISWTPLSVAPLSLRCSRPALSTCQRIRKPYKARWTYGQIYDWFRYIHSHLHHVAVNTWALDEWRNRIYYGTVDEAAGLELDRQLAALNVPCFLVAREVVGEIHVNE